MMNNTIAATLLSELEATKTPSSTVDGLYSLDNEKSIHVEGQLASLVRSYLKQGEPARPQLDEALNLYKQWLTLNNGSDYDQSCCAPYNCKCSWDDEDQQPIPVQLTVQGSDKPYADFVDDGELTIEEVLGNRVRRRGIGTEQSTTSMAAK
jgi:hypothetical protein